MPKPTVPANARVKSVESDVTEALAFTRHDHRRCKRSAMASVEALCAERSLRLTPVRRRTLEILLESHSALGAYDVLERLAMDGYGEKPPQVYRALGFLLAEGFAHKLEASNAYIACVAPGVCRHPCFMVCVECGRVAEQSIPKLHRHLNAAADELGFAPQASVMELSGVCGQCPRDK